MLSTIGIIHTVVSLVAIPFAITAYVQRGRIDLATRVGQAYFVTALVGAVTAFGVIKTPQGLGLTVMTLLALFAGLVVNRIAALGRARPYLQTIALSGSFFFVLLPGFTETVTRLPVGAPLAASPQAPLALAVQGLVFVGLVVGLVLQTRALRVGTSRAVSAA